MPRLPYRPDHDPGPEEVVAAIRERRGGTLLKMDRLMLHSPAFAGGWNRFLGVVIGGLSLPVRDSQFVMCVIGVLNGADYELFSHAPQFLAAGGRQAQLDALSDLPSADDDLFSERERAIMVLTLEMTRTVSVSDETFTAARAAMRDDCEMTELVGLIATYNMVSRFVVALDIHADDGRL